MLDRCLFPVAGYGTRFLPATKALAKEMLPIVDKPLVQYAVEEAMDAGLKRIGFVTGRGKRAIADHFDLSYELEHQIHGSNKEIHLKEVNELMEKCTFSFVRQKEMKGLGNAILEGETLIGNEPFAVSLADVLCLPLENQDNVLHSMVKLYRQFRCTIIAVEKVPTEHLGSYGVIAGEPLKEGLYRVTDMVEKPSPEDAPSNLGILGRYILTPDIFEILRNTPPGIGGEVQLTDAIKQQAEDGCVIAFEYKGKRFDCGRVGGFIEANNYVYENMYIPKWGK